MQNEVSDETDAKLAQAFLQFYRLYHFSKARNTDNSEPASCDKKYCKLRFSEYLLMFYLKYSSKGKESGMTASELSSIMKVKPPTINPLLSNLEKIGLIDRYTDKNDRRFVRIELTESGKKLTAEKETSFRKKFHSLACYLGDEKSRLLADLVNEVYAFLSSQDSHGKNINE